MSSQVEQCPGVAVMSGETWADKLRLEPGGWAFHHEAKRGPLKFASSGTRDRQHLAATTK
jgi:hypothetical protein